MSTLDQSAQCLLEPQSSAQDSLIFLTESSKTISHFLHYFVESDQEVENLFTEIVNSFRKSVLKSQKLPAQLSYTLLKACLTLLKKHNHDLSLVQKVNDMLYEEVLHQSLSPTILDPDQIASVEDLLRLRSSKWNSSTKLVMDLLFQEGLSTQKLSQLLRLSPNVLEAHLYTLFHRLIGEVDLPPDNEDELALLQDMLASKFSRMDASPFRQRMAVLKSLLSLELRSEISSDTLINICKSWHPDFVVEEEAPLSSPSDSVIESIRKQNEKRAYQEKEVAKEEVAQYLGSMNPESIPKANEDVIRYAKLAVPVLLFFFLFTTYKTLNPEQKEVVVEDSIAVISIQDFEKQSTQVLGEFNDANGKTDIYPFQNYSSAADALDFEMKNGVIITLEPYTSVSFSNAAEMQLIRGKILIHLNKNPIQVLCMHGRIESSDGVIHLANWNPEYSVAGVFKGSLIAHDNFSNRYEVPQGKQIQLGLKENGSDLLKDFNSQSFVRPALRPRSSLSASHNNHRTDYQDRLTDEEVLELLPSREKISEKPEDPQKDFFQKL